MKSSDWTRLDVGLVSGAVILLIVMASARLYTEIHIYRAANQVIANVWAINETVQSQHTNTGRWFPKASDGIEGTLVYLNPFTTNQPVYQNLEERWLRRESNSGIVLQLVRHDDTNDSIVDNNIFPNQLVTGDPYLRLLVEYGATGDLETIILQHLEERVGSGLLVEINNHLYVLDLRGLDNE